ncbi:MAG: neutral/alkaline non-lysosomal ceramidase N-terminal domain-containing protein [Sinimarinibacterium sp.]|jgi:neutral ceramidase
MNLERGLILAAAAALCAACGQSDPLGDPPGSTGGEALIADRAGAACVLVSPLNQVGATQQMSVNGVAYTRSHQPDAPGPLERPIPNPGPQPAGSCRGSTGYRFGSGLYDDTGPIGGDPTGHADLAGMVAPNQTINGIHTRLYARAFAIESPCNGARVMFVSDDHAFVTALLRQQVLKAVAADPVLSPFYGPDNVMLSATHTHAANGGFGVGSFPADPPPGTPQQVRDAYNYVISAGDSPNHFDADNFRVMVDGIVQAMRRAHANLAAHAGSAPIRMSIGELLNANTSRDPPAYQQNSPAERARFSDANGHDIPVDKRFLQLSFVRANGSAVGVLNWFGVHPTAMHNHDRLISSDLKGYASLGFETLMETGYAPDPGGVPSGEDNFVAAFAQTDEGNSIPDLFVFDADVDGGNGPGQGVPYRYRFGTDDPYWLDEPGSERGAPKAAAVFGTKHLAQAIRQFGAGSALSGPVDYRLFHVDMNAVTVDDPAITGTLAYPDLPQNLYADAKATCSSALGQGFLAGGVNGPQFGVPGFTCVDNAPIPYRDQMRSGYNGLYNGSGGLEFMKNGVYFTVPVEGVPLFTASAPLLCATYATQAEYACQNEKPILVGPGGPTAPIQIFRIGNLAVLGVPWEVTTMSALRLRQTVLDALAPVGVDTVVIAGLSNAYFQYMATREEYTAQMYEGASTLFGPWQLAAVQQESRRLALTLAAGAPAPTGAPPPADVALGDPSPVTTDQPAEFGRVLADAQPAYNRGDTVDVSWVAGYPGNDLKTMSSYLYVERQDSAGAWRVVATDKDPELLFIWNWASDPVGIETHVVDSSTAQAVWTIPNNAAGGVYRIRHEGVSRTSADAAPEPYTGVTTAFRIEGDPEACP